MRALLLGCSLALACGRTVPLEPRVFPPDAGPPDAGPVDAGPPDAGPRDAGRPPPTEPCIVTPFPGIRWQFLQDPNVVCFGKTFDKNGHSDEYAFANIPAEDDRRWAAVPEPDISFSGPSRLCTEDGGPPVCACRAGGDFTYFQARIEIVRSPVTFHVSIRDVDDGVRVTLFNSKHPNGFVGGFAFLFGGTTADFAAETVVGSNRIVLTHVDDCCRDRRIANATIVLDGQDLVSCP